MNNRFSINGDGKQRAHSAQNAPPPKQPNEHERQVIDSLTGRYDELEALWKEAEKDLKQFRIPSPVMHLLYSDYECCPSRNFFLAWTRYGKEWRICHVQQYAISEVDDQREDECDTTPIIDCPVETRLHMISQFENLRRKVIEEAEKVVPRLDEAIANFRKILKS